MDIEQLNQLEQQLQSPALNLRKQALDQLAQLPSELAVPILQRAAQNIEFLQRRFAVMGLAQHPTPESLAVLQQLLETEQDGNVVAEIANSLFEFGEQAFPLLTQLFERNDHWLVRHTILAVLSDADRPEILLPVAQLGLQDKTAATRETAILALGRLVNGACQQEAIALLREVAQSPEWRDRWRAATALIRGESDEAKQLIAQLRQDPHHTVVAATLESNFIDHNGLL